MKTVQGLFDAKFLFEVKYTEWLFNVVLVKNNSGKWRMCVNYTDLNKWCSKDLYHIPVLDKLVDNSTGYKFLSFMNAYFDYNQISIYERDWEKISFMTKQANYQYNVMPFGLKFFEPTYQRMMNKYFKK